MGGRGETFARSKDVLFHWALHMPAAELAGWLEGVCIESTVWNAMDAGCLQR